LTLAEVFDGLSYYSDHQAEINLHIEQNRIPDDLLDPLTREAYAALDCLLTKDRSQHG